MQPKKLTHLFKKTWPIIFIGSFSFLINYHYGFIGMMPMDNTVLFNGGYRVFSGQVPFSDYWLVTGPLLDYLNAFFFKILGISWTTFIIHSSIFNSLIAIASYYFFKKMNLSDSFSIIYSLFISILFYPVVGTPFVDHHSIFFLILAFYSLILAVKTKNLEYYIYIPSILCLSFLSKQTPAAYGMITIPVIILFISFFKKKERVTILKNLIIGSVIAISFILLFFLITEIDFKNFIQQYIFYASSIGDDRLSNYDFNFLNEITKYKFIFYFVFLLLFILIKFKLNGSLDIDILIILLTSIIFSLLLVTHQAISLNQNFIFFIIPFLCGVAHSNYNKLFKKNYFLIFTFLICVFSVGKYHLRFNEERKFNELENIDISRAVDAKILDKKLSGLKWITYIHPDDPQKELKNLSVVMKLFSKEPLPKMLITDYQIIAPILNIYDNSPNQWHHPSVSFPLKGSKYFETYKKYFITKIKKNKIVFIFETREDSKTITELVLDDKCFTKERISEMLIKIKLNNKCKDFE